MAKMRWPLVLVLAAACGGTRFTAVPDTDGGDAESPDAMAVDGSAADTSSLETGIGDAGVTDSTTGDTGVPTADSGSGADDAGDSSSHDATGSDAPSDASEETDGAGTDAADADTQDAVIETGVPDAGADAADAADAAEAEACAPIVYFLDGDGDGYGGTTTAKACTPPDSGVWVTTGGDCDDSNLTVNPGQAAYFSQGYVPTGKSTPSYDYNCDGQESEAAGPAKADCGFSGLSCVGSGYLEASPLRGGAGVDPYCGSDQAVNCAVTNLVCQAGPAFTTSPVACH